MPSIKPLLVCVSADSDLTHPLEINCAVKCQLFSSEIWLHLYTLATYRRYCCSSRDMKLFYKMTRSFTPSRWHVPTSMWSYPALRVWCECWRWTFEITSCRSPNLRDLNSRWFTLCMKMNNTNILPLVFYSRGGDIISLSTTISFYW